MLFIKSSLSNLWFNLNLKQNYQLSLQQSHNSLQRGLTPDNIGFDIVGGKDEPVLPNDYSVYVNRIVEGSVADGKLK